MTSEEIQEIKDKWFKLKTNEKLMKEAIKVIKKCISTIENMQLEIDELETYEYYSYNDMQECFNRGINKGYNDAIENMDQY